MGALCKQGIGSHKELWVMYSGSIESRGGEKVDRIGERRLCGEGSWRGMQPVKAVLLGRSLRNRYPNLPLVSSSKSPAGLNPFGKQRREPANAG